MRIVIKIAGALLENAESITSLSSQVAELARQRHELLVIHGGGKIFTNILKRMGVASRFVGGLRVTDRDTRDVAIMVFAGLLNKRLTSAISLTGQSAVGICAADAACFRAEPVQTGESSATLGYVGYLTGVNLNFLQSLWNEALVPVACCLGMGTDGEIYNINADHMAAAASEYCRADRLIFLTDVDGVLDGREILSAVDGAAICDLIRRNVVSGGMVLKLEAAKRASDSGVEHVRIVGGNIRNSLLAAANDGNDNGTRVLPMIPAAQPVEAGVCR